ncbi:MAG: hypothetical protein LBD23_03085 [Oscillospiraceae bacterium]|jgi:hypothetical protein|nr:hypothetical protein [Oscillospiraceae bacterium]
MFIIRHIINPITPMQSENITAPEKNLNAVLEQLGYIIVVKKDNIAQIFNTDSCISENNGTTFDLFFLKQKSKTIFVIILFLIRPTLSAVPTSAQNEQK